MSADNTVTAHFTEIPLACYNLTLSHTGQGSDPVADPTHSIDCPTGRYNEGETIELSGASPDAGWRTSGWAGTSQTNSTADTNSLTMPAGAHVATVIYKVYVEIPAIFGGAAVAAALLSLSRPSRGMKPFLLQRLARTPNQSIAPPPVFQRSRSLDNRTRKIR